MDCAPSLLHRLAGHPLAPPTASQSDEHAVDGLFLDGTWSAEAVPPPAFRGDTNFVWQARCYNSQTQFNEALRAAHTLVAGRDRSGFLSVLSEDGAFGAQCTLSADGRCLLSRDLLDSTNELSFLEEMLELSSWPEGAGIVDIGGGYGRLAHRVSEALPHLRVISTDGVAGSLMCAQTYLHFRAVPAEIAQVVPPDEIEEVIERTPPRCSVNRCAKPTHRSTVAP